jgi:MSHA biogenesis protein MshG
MSSLKHRIQFYHTLGTLEDAGVPRVRALQQSFPGIFRRIGERMSKVVSHGGTLSEGMESEGRVFSSFERNLVLVGEQTGRLDLVFRSLADWFQLVRTLRSRLISGLIYPLLVYHVAGVLIAVISVFTDGISPSAAAFRTAVWIAAPWVLYFSFSLVLPLIFRGGLMDAVLLHVPVVGAVSYTLNCTRFFYALALCLRSGLGMSDAIRLSAGGCTNRYLERRFRRIVDTMRSVGCTFTEALAQSMIGRDRGSMILELMRTGEQSGRTDEAAERIANNCREEAETLLIRIAAIVPTVVYLVIAVYIAFKIISFYGKLLAPVRDLL